jgi:hypothetical protein
MDAKITELISLLSVDEDFELIQALCLKLSQILAEKEKSKDFEDKYSIESIRSSKDIKKMYHGLSMSVKNEIIKQDHRLNKKKIQINNIISMTNNFCDNFCPLPDYYVEGACDNCYNHKRYKCAYKKRSELEEEIHNKAKSFLKTLDDDFLVTKYLVNKINRKLEKLKL